MFMNLMAKKSIYLTLALVVVLCMLFALSSRVHALGTTANTVITAPTYNYSITFKDTNLVNQPTFNPTVPLNSTPVTAIYGLITAVDPTQVTRSIRAGLGSSTMTQAIRSRSNPELGV